MASRPRVTIFTDGALFWESRTRGWAFILREESGEEREGSDGEARTTNNRMELLAAINGLEELPGPCRVELYSDSQYVVKGISEWMDGWKAKGWKRPRNAVLKNLELWKRLDELRQIHDIEPIWVRGHNDHAENERCDELAVAAAERFKDGD